MNTPTLQNLVGCQFRPAPMLKSCAEAANFKFDVALAGRARLKDTLLSSQVVSYFTVKQTA